MIQFTLTILSVILAYWAAYIFHSITGLSINCSMSEWAFPLFLTYISFITCTGLFAAHIGGILQQRYGHELKDLIFKITIKYSDRLLGRSNDDQED